MVQEHIAAARGIGPRGSLSSREAGEWLNAQPVVDLMHGSWKALPADIDQYCVHERALLRFEKVPALTLQLICLTYSLCLHSCRHMRNCYSCACIHVSMNRCYVVMDVTIMGSSSWPVWIRAGCWQGGDLIPFRVACDLPHHANVAGGRFILRAVSLQLHSRR